jgi:hypothetical protein
MVYGLLIRVSASLVGVDWIIVIFLCFSVSELRRYSGEKINLVLVGAPSIISIVALD